MICSTKLHDSFSRLAPRSKRPVAVYVTFYPDSVATNVGESVWLEAILAFNKDPTALSVVGVLYSLSVVESFLPLVAAASAWAAIFLS